MDSKMKRTESPNKTKYRILVYDNGKISIPWGLKSKPYLQYKSQMDHRFKDKKRNLL